MVHCNTSILVNEGSAAEGKQCSFVAVGAGSCCKHVKINVLKGRVALVSRYREEVLSYFLSLMLDSQK